MKGDFPRVLFIVIDQLAGHWAEGVKVEGDFPPANVWGYHQKGLIPNFSRLINEGLWAPAWNMGECDTSHGMKYLASGRYKHKSFWGGEGKGRFYPEEDKEESLFEFAKIYHRGKIRVAVFTTDLWIAKGYFYTPEDMHAFPSYFPDDPMWHAMALPWLRKNTNWDLVHIYFATNDQISFCPSYQRANAHERSSKHSYLLYLNSLLGEIIEFLEVKKLWGETFLVLAADHGYHLGCSTARKVGAKSINWCADHPGPHDCEIWDFAQDRSTGVYSRCSRRIPFIVSGGALAKELRGKALARAEIIDVAATIADILKVPYSCEGSSVLKGQNQ
jgi:hypothetical protein